MKRAAVVLDLDGTLFDVRARFAAAARAGPPGGPSFWNAFLDTKNLDLDAPLPRAVECVREIAREHAVVYLSGRRAGTEEATRAQLRAAGLPDGEVVHRPRGAPPVAFKIGALRELGERYALVCGIGDRPDDAVAYAAAGVPAVAVLSNVDWDGCPCRGAAESARESAQARERMRELWEEGGGS